MIMAMSMAMLWAAGFTKEMKSKLLCEAITAAIFLHDIVPTARNKKSAYELWTGKAPRWKSSDLIESLSKRGARLQGLVFKRAIIRDFKCQAIVKFRIEFQVPSI